MKFLMKYYKYKKIEKYLKYTKFFLLYNGTNVKNSIKITQKLKALDLHCDKTYNTLMKFFLKNSIFVNFQQLISCLITVVKFNSKNTNLTFQSFLKLNEFLYLIAIKINNKCYIISKIPFFLQLDYKKDHLIFLTLLKMYLKTFYKLT